MQKTIVTVTTAQKLSSEQKKEILSLLSSKLNAVEIDEVIDPSVIGGLKLKVGNQEFDITTAGKLKAMESLLPQVKVQTAVALSTAQREKVEEIIKKKVGHAEIIEEVDPQLLGGIKIIFAAEEYDGSVKGKIDKLKSYMMNNI